MVGKLFFKADYVGGHGDVGTQRIKAILVDEPAALVVRTRKDNSPLFGVAWINISETKFVIVDRALLPRFAGEWGFGRRTEYALELIVWDPEVQREQKPIFALGLDKERFSDLSDYIMRRRDESVRGLNQATDPN